MMGGFMAGSRKLAKRGKVRRESRMAGLRRGCHSVGAVMLRPYVCMCAFGSQPADEIVWG